MSEAGYVAKTSPAKGSTVEAGKRQVAYGQRSGSALPNHQAPRSNACTVAEAGARNNGH